MAADQAAAIEFPAIPGSARASLDELIAEQEEIFIARQPESRRLASRAAGALAGGVTSSWQSTRPQPVWLSHGQGSKIYDVDGNEYVDMAGGYGAALAGHAHPAIVDAIRGQVSLGTHFAQPTRSAIIVAEELLAALDSAPARIDLRECRAVIMVGANGPDFHCRAFQYRDTVRASMVPYSAWVPINFTKAICRRKSKATTRR